jgi:hypothetical protein
MAQQYSIASLQQQLTQLNSMRNDQLNGLLERLESQKAKLPNKNHSIIDWGIQQVKTKIWEEERFMNETDERLEQLKYKFSDYQTFITHHSDWEKFNGDGEILYEEAWKNLREIIELGVRENRVVLRTDFADIIDSFKQFLWDFCKEEYSTHEEAEKIYTHLIGLYIDSCESAEEFPEIHAEFATLLTLEL